MYGKTYQGRYLPINPEKYTGDVNNIVYRSSWERHVMVLLDTNENVIEWNSEELVIPYISPLDNRYHRYFPDFMVLLRDKDGQERTVVIEVKPDAQTKPPERGKKVTKRFIREATTYAVNYAKWEAADRFCKQNGMEFKILTENNLNISL